MEDISKKLEVISEEQIDNIALEAAKKFVLDEYSEVSKQFPFGGGSRNTHFEDVQANHAKMIGSVDFAKLWVIYYIESRDRLRSRTEKHKENDPEGISDSVINTIAYESAKICSLEELRRAKLKGITTGTDFGKVLKNPKEKTLYVNSADLAEVIAVNYGETLSVLKGLIQQYREEQEALNNPNVSSKQK